MKRHAFKYLLVLIICVVGWTLPAYALPSFEEVRAGHVKSDSLLLDRHGAVLHELRTDKQGRRLDWTKLDDISPSLKEAVICSEDKRFYDHAGVDYRAFGSAALGYLSGAGLRGASTITMQLASFLDKKIAFKKKQRSLSQKASQIGLARDIEKQWSKNEILEAYLNLVTFRGEFTGIAASSRGLFGKDPHGLDQPESLILACLIRAPNAQTNALEARMRHLNQRLNWPIADHETQKILQNFYLAGHFIKPRAAQAPQIARQLLQKQPPGAHLLCTLDAGLQNLATQVLAEQVNAYIGQNIQQGALVILENKSGDVLAYVSYSSNPLSGTYVDGVRAIRQTGSTLKPFLYATALDRRILTAASLLDDSPLDVVIPGGIYQPENYDETFRGPVSVRIALASSLNVPAVRTLSLVGTESFLHVLRQLGISRLTESGDFYGLSLALGSADMSLWELTNAYRALANQGVWSEAHILPAGKQPATPRKKVFSPATAFVVSDILADREARSETFGLENPLATRFWSAVKTGTSKDMRDNWCLGFSRRYTIGVWVGNFSGEPMWNVSGTTGAAPVWRALMNHLHERDTAPYPQAPKGVIQTKDPESQNTPEWFIVGTEPNHVQETLIPANHRIIYPPSGTIIALDPDIPDHLQRIGFIAKTDGKPVRWIVNEILMDDEGPTLLWTPKPGKHLLAITNQQNNIVDSVQFEVR
jgi:penicillin-binding protein 1C